MELLKRLFTALSLYYIFLLPISALNIDYNFGNQVSQQAKDSANSAANVWESTFSDNVNVNVNINFASFSDPNVIGSTGSTKFGFNYDLGYSLLVNDITSNNDLYAVSSLPTTPFINFDNTPFSYISATSANLQALNVDRSVLEGAYGGSFVDMEVTLNSNFAFDYDTSNGTDSNKIDFKGLIVHELGHGLGFYSETDFVDFYANSGYNNSTIYNYALPSMLDLFRIDTNGNRTILPDNPASLFGMPGFEFSTGDYLGDGFQASHWKDDYLSGNYLGVMDPTLSYGTIVESPTFKDRLAFDVIGWDVVEVPEPGTIFLFIMGILGIIKFRKQN